MVFVKKIITFLVIISITSQQLFSQEIQLPNYDLDSKEIKFAMDFSNIMMRVSEELYETEDEFLNALKRSKTDEKALEPLRKGFLIYANQYEKYLSINIEDRANFQRYWKNLDLKKIAKLLNESIVGLKSFFKRRGFSVVLAMAMGLVSEWVVPAILIKIGLSYLLPVSMITPWSFMYLSIPNAIDKTLLKRKITKELGGKLQYQAYKAQRQATYDVLKLSNPDQLILPLAQDNNVIHAVVIPKQSTWNSLLTKIGLHPKKLNYQSLRLFLKEHNLEDNYVKWISSNPEFDKSIKVYLIVHHILKNENEEMTSNFKLKFSNHFVSVQNNVNWDVMKNWSKRMLLAPSIEDANILLKQVPEGTSVNEVLQLWQKMFLPEYASRLAIDYRAYRKMDNQLEILRSKSINQENPLWDLKWQDELIEKVISPMNKSLKSCKSKEASLLKYLILN